MGTVLICDLSEETSVVHTPPNGGVVGVVGMVYARSIDPPMGGLHTDRMPTTHRHPAPLKRQMLNRMNYIRGHCEAVRKMLEDDAYCPDVILQNLAVVKALKKVNELVLAQHLKGCARRAMRGRDAKARERVEREIIAIVRNSC